MTLSLSPFVRPFVRTYPFFFFGVFEVCVFQWCFKEVSRVFQGSFKGVSRNFKGVLRKFQGSFEGVSRKF